MSSQLEAVIPSLAIRADSTTQIGAGHIMRCIALAQAWQDLGGKVTFLSHCESETLKERIQTEGFGFIALDHVCPDSSDLKHTLETLEQLKTQNSKRGLSSTAIILPRNIRRQSAMRGSASWSLTT